MAESRLERLARYLNVSLAGQSFSGARENTQIIELFNVQLKGDVTNYVEVTQWLSFARSISVDDLSYLNELLLSQTYIVGGKLSLADVAVFDVIVNSADGLADAAAQHPNLRRWTEHVSVLLNTANVLYHRAPTFLPCISPFAASSDAETGSSSAGEPKAGKSEAIAKSPKKESESEKKPKPEKSSEDAKLAAAAADEDLDPSKLDIRVGIVRKCWDHENSDKLLCEEVDIGEDSVRRIGSGLRHFYKAEEFEGKKVLVLANLKERSLGGFPSHVRTCAWRR
jgi:tRNA-binding EMAP/Myf-like protein